MDALNADAFAQASSAAWSTDRGAHAIAPEPAGRRQFEHARQAAVVGQQQQPSVLMSSRPTATTRGRSWQSAEDRRRPSESRLVPARAACEQEKPCALVRLQRLAVDADVIALDDIDGGAGQLFAVELDAAGEDPRLPRAANRGRRAPSPWRCVAPDDAAGRREIRSWPRLALRAGCPSSLPRRCRERATRSFSRQAGRGEMRGGEASRDGAANRQAPRPASPRTRARGAAMAAGA